MTPSPGRKVGRIEDAISGVLRTGVSTSLVLISAGTLITFVRGGYGGRGPEVARLIGPGGSFPRTASWFFGGLLHLDGQAVIVAGLLLLVVTPVTRVAVSLVAFATERDRTYVSITALILLLLLLSFALGNAG